MSADEENGGGEEQGERRKEESERLDSMVQAIRIYQNYFIPVHEDGRTASEYLEWTPPPWLLKLVSEHRESKLPFNESRIARDDPTLFSGMLTSSIIRDILDHGGTTERSRVVMMLMSELSDPLKKGELYRSEQLAPEDEAATDEEALLSVEDVSTDLEADDGDEDADDEIPKIVIPYVSIYTMKNKVRTRALLQTHKEGTASVTFYGVHCKAKVDRKEDDPNVFTVYCSYPVQGGEDLGGARLGAIVLSGESAELSSTAEERHRALRDFFVKLAGEKNVRLESEMENAVVDRETGELVPQSLDTALSFIQDKDLDELLTDGLAVCLSAGFVVRRQEENARARGREGGAVTALQVSPEFVRSILESYKELGRSRQNQSGGELLKDAMFKRAFECVVATNTRLKDEIGPDTDDNDEDDEGRYAVIAFETSVGILTFLSLLGTAAREDGNRVAEEAVERLSDQKPLSDVEAREFLRYLERNPTMRMPDGREEKESKGKSSG